MKPNELATALRLLIEIKQPVCISSAPGMGKSSITHQVGAATKNKVLDIRAVLLDAVDVHGLPTVSDGRVKWAIPDMWPREGEGIIFLDELNRAPMLVQNALFQLVLDRKIGTDYVLPEGWSVVAAINPTGGGTTKMSDALSNRFVHLQLEVDLNDWVKWANTTGIAPEVVAFLRFKTHLLHEYKPGMIAFPSPRSWEFVSRITDKHAGNGLEFQLFTGAVGEGAATEYMAFLKTYRSLPDIDGILANPKKAPIPKDEPAVMYAIASALARRAAADGKNLAPIIQYVDRMPQEYAVCCMKDVMQLKPVLAAEKSFRDWTVSNQEVFS